MSPSVTCGWTFIAILQDVSLATRQGPCQMLYPILMYGTATFSKPTCYEIFFLDRATFLPILVYKKNGTMFAESLPKRSAQGNNIQHRKFQPKKLKFRKQVKMWS